MFALAAAGLGAGVGAIVWALTPGRYIAAAQVGFPTDVGATGVRSDPHSERLSATLSEIVRSPGFARRILESGALPDEATTEQIRERMDAQVGPPGLLRVIYEAPNQRTALAGANAIARVLVADEVARRRRAITKRLHTVESSIKAIAPVSRELEKEKTEGAGTSNSIDDEEVPKGDYGGLLDVIEIQRQYLNARIARIAADEAARSEEDPMSVRPAVTKLEQELAFLDGRRSLLAENFSPEYPELGRLDQRIGEIRNQLASLRGAAHLEMVHEANAARSLELDLKAKLDRALAQTRSDDQVLKTGVDLGSPRTLRLAQLEQSRRDLIADDARETGPALVHPATLPTAPTRAPLAVFLTIGALLAASLAEALLWLRVFGRTAQSTVPKSERRSYRHPV
ncbi:hypothetical protein F7D01_13530 [Erythrobacter sp. 3-20A1M]|uniref:hypothetical protein n=1 Tax=Erythrobacter sp. 3-20A1M TaxID=2653850 RepID=UPI001BFCADCF|nr:hypothetical protein [Erythrobacter sp. 3-20A1M]QWC57943.1 hypothetical protein F7D01_13530 [Erythrobacter sp. 3-20A1M]